MSAVRLAGLLDEEGSSVSGVPPQGPRRAMPEPSVRKPVEPGVAELPSSMPGGQPATAAVQPEQAVEPAESAEPPGSVREVAARAALSRFSRWHVGVVCVLVLLGVLTAGWSLLRARPVAVATPLAVQTSVQGTAFPSRSTRGVPAGSDPSSPATDETILVHVLGAVRRPGVVSLPPDARVRDAIEKAGGLSLSADPDQLNLAQILTDGQQIVVGTKAEPTGLVRTGTGSQQAGPGSDGGALLDLNSATPEQLDQLPGVGPVTAERILSWRTEHGRFSRVDELQEVDGIGPKTYARIAAHVRV